ncbi:MAG: hypothetical protein LBB18_00365, partial [Puniceicoccales bacterium]|nr:hypothetical protein [Puniceicoccales bacterium]
MHYDYCVSGNYANCGGYDGTGDLGLRTFEAPICGDFNGRSIHSRNCSDDSDVSLPPGVLYSYSNFRPRALTSSNNFSFSDNNHVDCSSSHDNHACGDDNGIGPNSGDVFSDLNHGERPLSLRTVCSYSIFTPKRSNKNAAESVRIQLRPPQIPPIDFSPLGNSSLEDCECVRLLDSLNCAVDEKNQLPIILDLAARMDRLPWWGYDRLFNAVNCMEEGKDLSMALEAIANGGWNLSPHYREWWFRLVDKITDEWDRSLPLQKIAKTLDCFDAPSREKLFDFIGKINNEMARSVVFQTIDINHLKLMEDRKKLFTVAGCINDGIARVNALGAIVRQMQNLFPEERKWMFDLMEGSSNVARSNLLGDVACKVEYLTSDERNLWLICASGITDKEVRPALALFTQKIADMAHKGTFDFANFTENFIANIENKKIRGDLLVEFVKRFSQLNEDVLSFFLEVLDKKTETAGEDVKENVNIVRVIGAVKCRWRAASSRESMLTQPLAKVSEETKAKALAQTYAEIYELDREQINIFFGLFDSIENPSLRGEVVRGTVPIPYEVRQKILPRIKNLASGDDRAEVLKNCLMGRESPVALPIGAICDAMNSLAIPQMKRIFPPLKIRDPFLLQKCEFFLSIIKNIEDEKARVDVLMEFIEKFPPITGGIFPVHLSHAFFCILDIAEKVKDEGGRMVLLMEFTKKFPYYVPLLNLNQLFSRILDAMLGDAPPAVSGGIIGKAKAEILVRTYPLLHKLDENRVSTFFKL